MGLKVNDRVVVGSKLGTLRFCGTTEFSTGIWAGVELDNAEGKNDGTVKGMRYFQCAPGHGIFVAARAVAKAGASYRPKEPEPRSRAPQKVVHHGKVDVSHVQAKFHSAMAVIAERTEVRVGDRVWVNDTLGPERGCRGTVRFLGSVDFVDDMADWYGVELDQALGRHDGTVQGVRYFAAGKDRGVFVTLNKLTKLDAGENIVDEEANETSLCESTLSRTSPAPSATPVASTSTPSARVRRSLSLRHHESRAASAAPSMTGSLCSRLTFFPGQNDFHTFSKVKKSPNRCAGDSPVQIEFDKFLKMKSWPKCVKGGGQFVKCPEEDVFFFWETSLI